MRVYHYNDRPKFKFRLSQWPARPSGMFFYTKRPTADEFRADSEYEHVVTLADELWLYDDMDEYQRLVNKYDAAPQTIRKILMRDGSDGIIIGAKNNELVLFHEEPILSVKTKRR